MVIWLTGIPGVGKHKLALALRSLLQNGRKIQILDSSQVRKWVHQSTTPSSREQVAAVAWIARLLTREGANVIVCCTSPNRQQRTALRHKFYEEGTPFYEVWVDGEHVTAEEERKHNYEHPDPPDSRIITGTEGWGTLAHRAIFELDL